MASRVVATGPESSVADALRSGRSRLGLSRTPTLDVEVLLAHVLGRDRAWLIAHAEDRVPRDALARFEDLVSRRARGEPVAYLRGFVEWFGLRLNVDPRVLIPRPETELLTEKAIAAARQMGAGRAVDVGTGSGAIAIAMAAALPDMRVDAVDASADALAMAKENAERSGVAEQISFLHGSLLEPVTSEPQLIVANLPYLSDEMMEQLDRDVRYEPGGALHGGVSGLEVYGALLRQIGALGIVVPVFVEIDPRQSTGVRALVSSLLPGWDSAVEQDYAGHDRIVRLWPIERPEYPAKTAKDSLHGE
ncbi:MAG TPA: peptide chain release factor N(5)-glutamine methyltransferase [Chloroflexota bacterium]|nr:peptide chain release factor N(5)-glutamine methyltransferase [Chloroflexota bacterium]